MVAVADLYAVLGVDPSASTADIKRAYKREALRTHPDRALPERREECTQQFKLVAEAYEVLSDEGKRRVYDQYGFPSGPSSSPSRSPPSFPSAAASSPTGPFTFIFEDSHGSARRAQANRRAGAHPWGFGGLDPFEMFNHMFHTEFARMGPEPDPFQNDPFFANHRRMADMGFGGYAPAPFAGMTDPWGPRMSQGSQRTADPFGFGPGGLVGGFGAPNIGHDVAGSRRTGAFGGTSESTSTRIVNGRKETTYRKVDQDGTETIQRITPEGTTVHVNGIPQTKHPLLGNASGGGTLPSTTDADSSQYASRHGAVEIPHDGAGAGTRGPFGFW